MNWTISEKLLENKSKSYNASIFTIGNGDFCSRGTNFEDGLGTSRCTYLSGVYTRGGHGLNFIMAAPNWIFGKVIINGETCEASVSNRELLLDKGIFKRTAIFTNGKTEVEIEEERFASFIENKVGCQRIQIKRIKGDEPVSFLFGIDADARNMVAHINPGDLPNVTKDGMKLSEPEILNASEENLFVSIFSKQTNKRIVASAKITQSSGMSLAGIYKCTNSLSYVQYDIPTTVNEIFQFEKISFLIGDMGNQDALRESQKLNYFSPIYNYYSLRTAHVTAVKEFWRGADVVIAGDDISQKAVRFSLWSTRIASPDNQGLSSIGAKNLTGDHYSGGVFWDMDVFQLPQLAATIPLRAKNHILYRTRTLSGARYLALRDGYVGARYPWTSFEKGDEDPHKGNFPSNEIHVSLDIVWGILHYSTLTGDNTILLDHGLETILEIARFFVSRLTGPDESGNYHLNKICGPNEFKRLGINDNSFTNYMLIHVLTIIPRLVAKLESIDSTKVHRAFHNASVTSETIKSWVEIADKIHIPKLTNGIIAEFEGYENIPEPDFKLNKGKWGFVDKTAKQGDVILLWQLIPFQYFQNREMMLACWKEYTPICHHLSSLSFSSHAIVATKLGLHKDAEIFYRKSAGVDLQDTSGNTDHGIHGAGEAGVWLATVHGFGGLWVDIDGVRIEPALPKFWESLSYRFHLTGQLLQTDITHSNICVSNLGKESVTLHIAGQLCTIEPASSVNLPYRKSWDRQKYEVLVVGLHGVLVDHKKFQGEAWSQTAKHFNLSYTDEIRMLLAGKSRRDTAVALLQNAGNANPSQEMIDQICSYKEQKFIKLIENANPGDLTEGVIEFLTSARDAGLKCAIATSSFYGKQLVEKLGLTEYVDTVVDGNLLKYGKPSADCFEVAMMRLRALPWNCLGIDNSPSGLVAMQKSGINIVEFESCQDFNKIRDEYFTKKELTNA